MQKKQKEERLGKEAALPAESNPTPIHMPEAQLLSAGYFKTMKQSWRGMCLEGRALSELDGTAERNVDK